MRHPNCVSLLTAFGDDTTGASVLVLVTEFVSGDDLLGLINSQGGYLNEALARHLISQLTSALLFIHSNGLCHRDVKPENAVVDSATGVLKLVDFGLSKHMESAKTMGVGTPDCEPAAE